MSLRDASTLDTLTPLSEQAAYWWVTLRDGECTAADRLAFAQWVTRSPERVEAYLRIVSFMAKLRSRDLQWPDDATEALIAAGKAEGAEIVHLPSPITDEEDSAVDSGPGRLRRPFAAVVAVLALVAAAAWLVLAPPQRYLTGLDEQRNVALPDGSFVTLNPSTAIEVDFRRDRRLVRIPGGEVLFQVARDSARPFEVIDERVTIRAVGTRFNVDCRSDQTTITVLDGSVVVEHRGREPLSAGDDSQSAHPGGTPPFVLNAAERIVVKESGLTSFTRLPGVRIETTGEGYRVSTTADREKR